jgi:hypothetical protein
LPRGATSETKAAVVPIAAKVIAIGMRASPHLPLQHEWEIMRIAHAEESFSDLLNGTETDV